MIEFIERENDWIEAIKNGKLVATLLKVNNRDYPWGIELEKEGKRYEDENEFVLFTLSEAKQIIINMFSGHALTFKRMDSLVEAYRGNKLIARIEQTYYSTHRWTIHYRLGDREPRYVSKGGSDVFNLALAKKEVATIPY
jgi:hypothetical protein